MKISIELKGNTVVVNI